ncbi:MAG: hypothetical protein JWM30_379, partial [Burkholderia sp.]|nr:hypothetical protein [Burkholderia sp.]
RQGLKREASETRCAQTADASLSVSVPGDASPSNGDPLQRPLQRQRPLQLQLQRSLRGQLQLSLREQERGWPVRPPLKGLGYARGGAHSSPPGGCISAAITTSTVPAAVTMSSQSMDAISFQCRPGDWPGVHGPGMRNRSQSLQRMCVIQLLQYPCFGYGQRRVGPPAWPGQRYGELGTRRAGHLIEHDDAVGQV